MSKPIELPTQSHPNLVNGDSHAVAGRWVSALESWYQAAVEDSALEPAVSRRVDWFLAHTGHRARNMEGATGWLALLSLAAALMATVFVLIPDAPGSTASNIWATGAWTMIVISTVSAVVAARVPATTSLQDMVRRAEAIARNLDSSTKGHETTT